MTDEPQKQEEFGEEIEQEKIIELFQRAGYDINKVDNRVLQTLGCTPALVKIIKVMFAQQRKKISSDMRANYDLALEALNEAKLVYLGDKGKMVEMTKEAVGPYARAAAKTAVDEAVRGSDVNKIIRTLRNRTWAMGAMWVASLVAAGGLAFILNKKINRTETGAMRAEYDGRLAQIGAENESLASENKKLNEMITGLKVQYEERLKLDAETRKQEIGGLEGRLGKRIDDKANKSELASAIADLNKGYTDLGATLKAEMDKNSARDKAYLAFKNSVDETKKEFEGFVKRYSDFESKVTTKEYTDAELGKLKESLAKIGEGIKKNDDALVQMQKENTAKIQEYEEIRNAQKKTINLYNRLDARIMKLEEEIRGYHPPVETPVNE